MKISIIDISQHNGIVNFNTLKKHCEGVIIRAGYKGYGTGRNTTDTMFIRNITCAIKSGLKYIGVYWLSQSVTTAEAKSEANYLVNILKPYKSRINYPVYIDSEWSNNKHNGRADGLTKNARTNITTVFLDTIKNAGYIAGIYASTSWYSGKLDNSKLKKYTHWVADYRGRNGYGKSDGWQYTEKYNINGNLFDRSVFYTDFKKSAPAPAPTKTSTSFKQGQAVKLTKANLYASQDSTKPVRQLTGTYYIYDGKLMHLGRYRITSKPEYCGKGTAYITGYVAYPNFK